MKKSLLALLMMATFALTFTGCKKDEDEEETVNITQNSFAIDGVKMEGDVDLGALFVDKAFLLSSADGESTVTILFNAKPTASGSFNIKGLLQLQDLGDNDLIITVTSNSKTYASNAAITEKVTVTVTDEKVSATIPKITLNESGTGESITFEAKLLEY